MYKKLSIVLFTTALFILLCYLSYFFIPIFYIEHYITTHFSDCGQIGDLIGGISNPLIGIVACVVTFLAFWIQYKANINQRNDISIERFESNMYEMLHLHKENLFDLKCGITEGRESFSLYFNKLKIIYILVDRIVTNNQECSSHYYKYCEGNNYEVTQEGVTIIAFNLFFYGGEYSISFERNSNSYLLYQKIAYNIECLESLMFDTVPTSSFSKEIVNYAIEEINSCDSIDNIEIYEKKNIPENLLCGYNDKLGVYYRQLYQLVSFISNRKNLDEPQKYKYVKLVRAQLSDYEQVMLYYSSLTKNGKAWSYNEAFESNKAISNMGLIPRFRLIKNISSSVNIFGYIPEKKFTNEIKYYRTSHPDKIFFDYRKIELFG